MFPSLPFQHHSVTAGAYVTAATVAAAAIVTPISVWPSSSLYTHLVQNQMAQVPNIQVLSLVSTIYLTVYFIENLFFSLFVPYMRV